MSKPWQRDWSTGRKPKHRRDTADDSLTEVVAGGTKEVAEAIAPQVQDLIAASVESYAEDLAHGKMPAPPAVVAVDARGRRLRITDPASGTWRTSLLVNGLATDMLVALSVWAGDLANADLFSKHGWQIIAISLVKTLLTAGFGFLARVRIAAPPSGDNR